MKIRKIVFSLLTMTMMISSLTFNAQASNKVLKRISSQFMTVSSNSEHKGNEIRYALDENESTFWDGAWLEDDKGFGLSPIAIEFEFKRPISVDHFIYTPRQDNNSNGMILDYEMLALTTDNSNIKYSGKWENNSTKKKIVFDTDKEIKKVILKVNEGSFQNTTSVTSAAAAEFSFYSYVSEITMNRESLALTEGSNFDLMLKDYEGTDITWESSNAQVATVSDDGRVTALKEGTTVVTATTHNGELATTDVSVSSKIAPVIPGMSLVFEDDFNGDTLDMTKWSNWVVDLKEEGLFRYGNSPEVIVHPDNAYVKDGTLRLLASKEETDFDGITSDYRSGMIHTRDKFEEKYGYIETMVRFPDVSGTNPAVWMMPQANEEEGGWQWGDKDNIGAEIDILERPHPEGNPQYAGLIDKYWLTIHYDNYENNIHEKYHTQPTITNPYQWHKFSMEWTPDFIKFFLDEDLVAIRGNDIPNTPEIFLLSYGLGGWIGEIDDSKLPAEMEVDYVRWYQDEEKEDSCVTCVDPSIDDKEDNDSKNDKDIIDEIDDSKSPTDDSNTSTENTNSELNKREEKVETPETGIKRKNTPYFIVIFSGVILLLIVKKRKFIH